jgi:phosphatidylglycerol:prolipoprotein diacylglycerol transferase
MNPIFVDLGVIVIKWYSVMIFLGLFLGGSYIIEESKKFKISEDSLINLAFWLIPFSLIGARLYYVLFNWDYYGVHKEEIIQIWNGGLAIHGAIIFGLFYIVFYTKKHKIETLRLLDMIAVALFLGQAIGRWGNFFNSEAYGSVVSLNFLERLKLPKFIIEGMYINGNYHHPTFLYESIWCVIGFIILLIIKRNKYIKVGVQTSFHFVFYGIGRLIIEFLRTDSLMLGNFKVAQIVSVVMIIIGILMYIWVNRGSKFERLYNPLKERKIDIIPKVEVTNITDFEKMEKPTDSFEKPNIESQEEIEKEGDLYKW